MKVVIAYATPESQYVAELELASGTTAAEAFDLACERGLLGELAATEVTLGIFGEGVAASYELQAGDRLEVYRPLLVDPKEARRLRAARGG